MTTTEQKAIFLLKEIVEWWELWHNSPNPSGLENPPINEAKAFLAQFQYNQQITTQAIKS